MQLVAARVTNFKSVTDSSEFSIGPLTCLVGKNESGKTAILEAIEKINALQQSRGSFSVTDHYPRRQLSAYEEAGEVAVAVGTRWRLTQEELEELNDIVGVPFVRSPAVRVEKGYDNQVRWTFDIDHAAVVEHLLTEAGLTEDERLALGAPPNVGELVKNVSGLDAPTERHGVFRSELEKRFPGGTLQAALIAQATKWLPKFLYYSSYDRLPGQVSLNQLKRDLADGRLDRDEGNKVFLALLSMVGTTPTAIAEISATEELIARLEGVQARFSERLFKYWSQNTDLKVRFAFSEALPADPPPFNEGKVFRTRIWNERHQVSIGLDERSTGFIWFFSFLVWFSEVQRQHGENLVVLLDEPGLSLHARAQGDLLRFIKEELLPKYQVIYTTHSPFMVDADDLLACRTVEDVVDEERNLLGTKVGDNVLSTDRDTLFPLQAALGYDITQTLFIGEHCLLVEGPSDLLYLTWFSNELERRGRVGLDARWTVTPCGGITKVPSFMALFGGSNLHVAVLTDYTRGDKRKVRELRESDLLRSGHVLTADTFAGQAEADIEDVVGRDVYRELVNAGYGLLPDKEVPATRVKDAHERVVLEVEEHFRTVATDGPEFDHFAPARYLIEHGCPDGEALDAALDRFERLFEAVNALL